MPSAEAITPVRMQRVALVVPAGELRTTLVRLATAGVVQLDTVETTVEAEAAQRLRAVRTTGAATARPCLARDVPDLDALVAAGRSDLLAGEAQLQERASAAVRGDRVVALAGWCPRDATPGLAADLAGMGAGVVPLPAPPGVDPPTQLHAAGSARRSFGTLVQTYGVVPYRDIDPTLLAGIAYVVMFGMMFGDAGHGLLLLLAAALLRVGRPRRWPALHQAWPFIAGAGAMSVVFGALYGDFFGPTGVLPVLWLDPMDRPTRLLVAGIGVGAVLLAGAYVLAIINRWREGGARLAIYASAGVAGAALFLGLGLLAGGLYVHSGLLAVIGGGLGVIGLLLAGAGFYADSSGGASGATQAVVEVVDSVIRLGSNVVSFARLAAFGLTHAALGWLVWRGTVALAGRGPLAVVLAVLVFVLGNLLAFSLEALIAGIQALRLEFYELFSRVFVGEGRPFRPWQVAAESPTLEVAS